SALAAVVPSSAGRRMERQCGRRRNRMAGSPGLCGVRAGERRRPAAMDGSGDPDAAGVKRGCAVQQAGQSSGLADVRL
ncbi:hypothetical protein NK983_32125, partial [Salmonella enterica subsp. enterica serovar Typhimurium]|nr:hypothetical protein [Salmonella enterica subsp. enterica serovar Typhimurium]